MRFIILISSIFILSLIQNVSADSEAPNQPIVKSSQHGTYYAKSIPEGFEQTTGKTYIYQVGETKDTLLQTYPWYSNQMYLLNNNVVRIGPWARGREANQEAFAIGFYFNGETVKEYSTLDIVTLAYKDPKNIQASMSHHTIFKDILGFGSSNLVSRHSFEVKTHENHILSFDIHTGQIRTDEDKKNDVLLDAVEYVKWRCYKKSAALANEMEREHILTEEGLRACGEDETGYIPPTPEGYTLFLGTINDRPKLKKIE